MHSSKQHDGGGTDTDDIAQQHVIPVGTFVEFEEKKGTHSIGKIESVEHKSSGVWCSFITLSTHSEGAKEMGHG
jgi:hypothetical protein